MKTVSVHVSLTAEAADLLDRYCTKRTRGAFLSQLVKDHDNLQHSSEVGLQLLLKRARQAQAEAARLMSVYNKAAAASRQADADRKRADDASA